jgi:hypothetical protein
MKEKSARQKNIIGIFDLDNSTVSGITKNFLSTAEKANKIIGINILPKSFVLIDADKNTNKKYRKNKKADKKYKKKKDFKIYFSSHISKYLKPYK